MIHYHNYINKPEYLSIFRNSWRRALPWADVRVPQGCEWGPQMSWKPASSPRWQRSAYSCSQFLPVLGTCFLAASSQVLSRNSTWLASLFQLKGRMEKNNSKGGRNSTLDRRISERSRPTAGSPEGDSPKLCQQVVF